MSPRNRDEWVEQRDAEAERVRMRAVLRRARQLLTLEDAKVLLALRELRVGPPIEDWRA